MFYVFMFYVDRYLHVEMCHYLFVLTVVCKNYIETPKI